MVLKFCDIFRQQAVTVCKEGSRGCCLLGDLEGDCRLNGRRGCSRKVC